MVVTKEIYAQVRARNIMRYIQRGIFHWFFVGVWFDAAFVDNQLYINGKKI